MSVFTRAACVVTSSSGSGKESMGPGAAGKSGSIDGLWRAGAVLYLSVGDETQGTAILVTRGVIAAELSQQRATRSMDMIDLVESDK